MLPPLDMLFWIIQSKYLLSLWKITGKVWFISQYLCFGFLDLFWNISLVFPLRMNHHLFNSFFNAVLYFVYSFLSFLKYASVNIFTNIILFIISLKQAARCGVKSYDHFSGSLNIWKLLSTGMLFSLLKKIKT